MDFCSKKPTSGSHFVNVLRPNKPKGSVVPKVDVRVAPSEGAATRPKGSVALGAQPKNKPQQTQLGPKRRLAPLTWEPCFAAVARHTIVAPIGVATSAAQNRLHYPGHDQCRPGSSKLLLRGGFTAHSVPHQLHSPRHGCPRTELQWLNSAGRSAHGRQRRFLRPLASSPSNESPVTTIRPPTKPDPPVVSIASSPTKRKHFPLAFSAAREKKAGKVHKKTKATKTQ